MFIVVYLVSDFFLFFVFYCLNVIGKSTKKPQKIKVEQIVNSEKHGNIEIEERVENWNMVERPENREHLYRYKHNLQHEIV